MTEDFLRAVHGDTKRGTEQKISSIMSPKKTEFPVGEDSKDDADRTDENSEEIELETSLRFLRGGRDAWKLKSFDVDLSKEATERIWDAFGRFLDKDETSELVAQIQVPFSAMVSRASLQTLMPGTWINDEVINFFMSKHNLYAARHARLERLPAPVVRCTNSFFFTKLNGKEKGYDDGVHAWSAAGRRNTHAWLESTYVFVPINIEDRHWMCAIVDVKSRVVYIVDSYNGDYHHFGDKLLEWICKDAEANHIDVGPKSAWKIAST